MKEFDLMSYLRRWWWLIVVISLVGGIGFFLFATLTRTYTAQTIVEYSNPDAVNGKYPTGDAIDVREIKSSTVISNAIASVKSRYMVDEVRSRVKITEIIPEDVAAISLASWEEGEEYDYFPVKYLVSYTSGIGESKDDARQVLEAIIDSYISLCSEKYISVYKAPDSANTLKNQGFDYIEYAEVLTSFVDDELAYLESAADAWPTYRSTATGYSFRDLRGEYELVSTIYLPAAYEVILNQHVTNDCDLLLARYQNLIEQNERAIESYNEHLNSITELMDSYAAKTRENIMFHWSTDPSSAIGGDHYVLDGVYNFGKNSSDEYRSINYQESAYKRILNQFISVLSDISHAELDNDYCRYILSYFSGPSNAVSEKSRQAADEAIAQVEERLKSLDVILSQTALEHSESVTAKAIRVRSTVNVEPFMNWQLYLLLIMVVFFLIGCVAAIVLGRGAEFLDYRFYTDPATGLPNRARCDMEIGRYTGRVLPYPFGCVAVALTNIAEINQILGRENADEVLRVFGGYLRNCADSKYFVGCNGGMQFIGLFPDCENEEAEYYCTALSRAVEEFNGAGHGVSIRFKSAWTCTTKQEVYTIHELLTSSLQKLRTAPEVSPVPVLKSAESRSEAPASKGETVSAGV